MVAAGCTLGQFCDSELGNVLWLFLRESTTTATLITFISLGEELVLLNLIRLNGLISWLPVSWAYLAMLAGRGGGRPADRGTRRGSGDSGADAGPSQRRGRHGEAPLLRHDDDSAAAGSQPHFLPEMSEK